MQRIAGLVAFLFLALVVFLVLQDEKTLVTHPKGFIARQELNLIATNYSLMLIIVIPAMIGLFYVACQSKVEYQPEKVGGIVMDVILWIIPSLLIAIMATHTWKKTYELDPYRPLHDKELKIQVIALDWKWLFIYPEQGIATVNYVQFPEKTPIHFELAADGSPMNSFWIPQLSGQIYAMTGMVTPLHLIADGIGEYRGKAAEINGEGYADMTFVAKSSSLSDFEAWVTQVKQSEEQLDYKELVKRSVKHPVSYYPEVEQDLFMKVVMKP
jgi:cytochrome o ubiquinol oxidase subunit 2